jgi:hypothetical protein
MNHNLRRAIVALLAVVAVGAGASSAKAGFINGGFESGDFTGWTVSSSLATVTTSEAKLGETGTWSAYEGNYFASVFTGGGNGVFTLLSQTFTAGIGDQLSFAIFFDAGDYLPFNDNGYARLIDANTNATVATLYSKDVAAVGDNGSSGWDLINYTFTGSGTFKMEFGVANFGDNMLPSALGVDAVSLQSPQAVPAPPAAILFALGAVGLAGGRALRRRLRPVAA